jgi:hypothetical protein
VEVGGCIDARDSFDGSRDVFRAANQARL